MTETDPSWTEAASLLVGASSLIVSLAALVIAGIAWRNSDRNSSASTLLAIFEAFRLGWERLEEPDASKRSYHFHSLMNLFEVGSAIHQDKSVHGASRRLLEDYMRDTLTMIANDKGARSEIARMRNDPNVFEYLRRFLKDMRLKGHPHFIETIITPLPSSEVAIDRSPSSSAAPDTLHDASSSEEAPQPLPGASRDPNRKD